MKRIMKDRRTGTDLFLRNTRDIEWVKQAGQRVSTAWFNLLIRRADGMDTRLAIIVGKRFGTAVSRNRAKRVFRELARFVRGRLSPGFRFLVFPRRECLTIQFARLRDVWVQSLGRCGLITGGGVVS
jgi:ribonuclease P protein component